MKNSFIYWKNMAKLLTQNANAWIRNAVIPIIDGLYTAWGRDTRNVFQFSNVPAFYIGTGTEYHVAKTGNDGTGDGLSLATAWLTIDFALQQITIAGQTLTIHAGNYQEIGSYTIQDSYRAALSIAHASGTLSEPITLRAAIGDEGLVNIDGQNTKAGVLVGFSDYIYMWGLRFINNSLCAVAVYDTIDPVFNPTRLSRGLRFENSYFGNSIMPASGVNTACLRLFGTHDLIIRNCYLTSTDTNCNGYQSYSQTNTLFEHNYVDVVNNGVYFKDHMIKDLVTREVCIGAEIRFNFIKTTTSALQVGLQGTDTQEAGYTYYHHNISKGHIVGGEYAAIKANMNGAFGQSTKLRIEHNIADMAGVTDGYFLDASAMDNIQMLGNIATGMKQIVNLQYSNSKSCRITKTDYNIYEHTGGYAALDRFSIYLKSYTTLTEWQAILAKDSEQVVIDNPDSNSIISSAVVLFTDPVLDDYTHKVGSPALGFMSDGSNAGAYQLGTEVIGLLPSYSAGT